jgi:oligopeptide/dipeptide ABC transporter ATP-binding protein
MQPLLSIQDLHKHFALSEGGLWGRQPRVVRAVDGVSFDLARGEILALVGESGCGKSTLALTLMHLEEPSGGRVEFEGRDITHAAGDERKKISRRMQMVFQDPYESLNPTQTIAEIVAEPLLVHRLAPDRAERQRRVGQALEDAGLRPAADYLARFPHGLSGGQRQRVVIAGALVLEPTLLLADEPVSMLDVSIRAEVLNLLAELRRTRGISVLFITHDLGAVSFFADRVAVMYLGRIVEIGPTRDVLLNPQHPYTRALLSVVPVPNPRLRRQRIILQGETPNPIAIPSGCRFHPRCPAAFAACRESDPAFVQIAAGHQAACLLASGAR